MATEALTCESFRRDFNKETRGDKQILRCSQSETAGQKPVNDLLSIRGPDPGTFEQREKRTHHMQLPAHRRLKSTCLSIPRTFPSGREPNLPILFHVAVPASYPGI